MKEYQLMGHNVYEGMYHRAETGIRNGKKVLFTQFQAVVEASKPADNEYCHNCDGAGKLGLEIVIGGPYEVPSDRRHVIWHDGKWYTHELVVFVCPDCSGSGLFGRKAESAAGIQL